MGDIEGYQLPEPCQTPNTHTYLRDLKAELTVLAANITAMYPEHTKEAERQPKAKNKATGHPLSTAVSLVVSDWENRMLLTAERQLRVMGRRVTTLICDGLHVMRLEGEETLPASILKACEAAILQETDLAVQLVVKPMPTTMQLSAAEDQKGADPYTTCRLLLLKNAKARQLVRMWGELWEPVPGTVCAYRQAVECTAEQDPLRAYVNQVLENEPEYHLKNDTSDKCVKYLQQYAHPDCPFVPGPDRSLISFKNGVYILPEDRFVANDSSEAADMKASHRIARHHLETDFTGSIETPLFDKLVTYQVEDPEVYKWLLVLLGRLQYKVGELDNWQVMLYVYGLAGTGKSTALKIYSKAFRPGAVEYLSSNTEEQFGLQKLASTRVEAIMCLDVPSDLPTTKVLRQDLWQQLVGGEEVNVPRKNGLARSERILCPMAMAGNKFLYNKDSNGNVSRRVAALRYQRYLPADMQDGDIENTVVAQELPAIILRCNRMYLEQARGSGKRGIWDVLPSYYKEIKHTAAQSVNPLREFLSAPRPSGPCRDTRYFALYDRDAKTSHSDLTHALQAYMRLNYPSIKAPSRWSADEVNPLYEMGFERSKMAVCKACRQKHIKGCCEFYDARNKTTEITWLHLRLVTVEPHDDEAAIF